MTDTRNAETKLVEILQAAPNVVALVGERIYADKVSIRPEQTMLPTIVHQRAETSYINTISNASVGGTVSLNIQCVASSYLAAYELADAVAAILSDDMVKTNRISDFDPETGLHGQIITVTIAESYPDA